jgi:4-hydroxybenzoate polyprenyltransferase
MVRRCWKAGQYSPARKRSQGTSERALEQRPNARSSDAAVFSIVIRQSLINIVRAGEWWEYKLAPIFAVFYATALTLRVPVYTLWPTALTILLALVPGAAYVSVINDLTDRDEDLAAGKSNRLVGKSRGYVALLIAITVAAGLAFCFLWRSDPLLLSVYLAAWLAFSLYSLPPFRWKARGIFGVLCDASGAHLFPTLVAVVLTYRGAGKPIDPLWLGAIALWSFAYGLRGILWHQLTDRENDQAAGVRTFVQRHPAHVAARLGTHVVFPIEVIALAVLLWRMPSFAPLVSLSAYLFFVVRRFRRWRMNVVIVEPQPHFLILLHEYYDVFLPIGILIATSLRDPRDLIALAVHVLIFPGRLTQSAIDVWKLKR